MIKPPLRIVGREEIEHYVGITYDANHPIPDPTENECEWYLDHSKFILRKWLPLIRPPFFLWAIVAEAYLSGIEAYCDGSSGVPDYLYRHGNLKDPQGITHDYLYHLHRCNQSTALGYTYGFLESNKAYRDLCWLDRWYGQAAVRWLALNAFGLWAWTRKYDDDIPLDHEIVTA